MRWIGDASSTLRGDLGGRIPADGLNLLARCRNAPG
jgi:hypothetical protein